MRKATKCYSNWPPYVFLVFVINFWLQHLTCKKTHVGYFGKCLVEQTFFRRLVRLGLQNTSFWRYFVNKCFASTSDFYKTSPERSHAWSIFTKYRQNDVNDRASLASLLDSVAGLPISYSFSRLRSLLNFKCKSRSQTRIQAVWSSSACLRDLYLESNEEFGRKHIASNQQIRRQRI